MNNEWTERIRELEKENETLKKALSLASKDIFKIVLMADIDDSGRFINAEEVTKHYMEKAGK